MADDTEINPAESVEENLETPEIDADNEVLDSPEEIENDFEGGGPSDAEVSDVAEKTITNVEQDTDETLNGPGINDHLRDLMGDPSYSTVGEGELKNIVGIEEDIIREEKAAKDYIRKIAGLKNLENDEGVVEAGQENVTPEKTVESEVVEDTGGNMEEEVPQSDEVIDGEWRFLDEDIPPETKEFLESNGLEDISRDLSPEELEKFEEIKQLIADNFRQLSVSQNLAALGVNNILTSGEKEDSNLKEAIKVLLRIAVRTGTRTIAFIADEIVKSADKEDKATKFLFGSIRDSARGIESMSDTLITGENKPERATKAVSDILRGKHKK